MAHDDQIAHVTQRVVNALRSVASQPAADDELQAIAADLVRAWQQHDHSAAHAIGARLVQHGITASAFTAIERALTADGTDESWQFVERLLNGYIGETRRTTQAATVASTEATQQREDQLRAVIQELSTPIIPIYSGVLVLPLVGAIDSMRSQEITERLLEEIVRQQADLVIIDITGVSVVDTSVANHLIMTAQAVNLLGSKVVFTGISSTIAQTIVQLGVSLGDVVTLSNLQAGMSYALEQLGLEITELAAV
jgi:anti-anti-sigma regulatory factor